MKKTLLLSAALALALAAVLAGCGKSGDGDVLSTINRDEPYTAELPAAVTQIEPEDSGDKVPIGTVYNASSPVNVRDEPSTSGAVIGTAEPGTKFLVTEENAAENWHKIDYKGLTGYINSEYLSITMDTADALAPAPDTGDVNAGGD